MKRSRRLDPVVRITEFKEQEAAKQLATSLQQLQLQQQRLTELQAYRDEYAKRFQETAMGGMSATQLRSFQAFMDKLDQAIGYQTAAIDRFRQDYEAKKRQWLAARNKTKALDTVVDRYRRQEQNAEERQAQKEQDERNNRGSDSDD